MQQGSIENGGLEGSSLSGNIIKSTAKMIQHLLFYDYLELRDFPFSEIAKKMLTVVEINSHASYWGMGTFGIGEKNYAHKIGKKLKTLNWNIEEGGFIILTGSHIGSAKDKDSIPQIIAKVAADLPPLFYREALIRKIAYVRIQRCYFTGNRRLIQNHIKQPGTSREVPIDKAIYRRLAS